MQQHHMVTVSDNSIMGDFYFLCSVFPQWIGVPFIIRKIQSEKYL